MPSPPRPVPGILLPAMVEAAEATAPRRLLIVDDDQEFAESIADILIPAGYAPVVVDRSETAVIALKRYTPAVALIDVRLRGMSGVELLARLKAEQPDLVVVMMTAHADTQTTINALRKGAYDYCDKNCDPDELMAALNRAYERHRLEAENRAAYDTLRAAKEAAEAASRAKTDFLANVSHELRTPLNAIIGFSELMLNGARGPIGNADYHGYLKDIFDAGTDLLRLINEILDLSKAEAGKLELLEDTVDVVAVVRTVTRLVGPRADVASLALETRLPDVPPLLFCDRLKLKQILLNLLSNALKFTEPGGKITVSLDVDPQRGLCVAVHDSGIGISATDLPRVLQPFVQVDSALNRTHTGTGLGLPLAAAMVELHGGTLAIESEPGQGTTVKAFFPLARIVGIGDVVSTPAQVPAPARTVDETPASSGPSKLRQA
jgi:signal transduction histidine kinase